MKYMITGTTLATLVVGLTSAATMSPASASTAWSALQASVPYTVYEPYATHGLPRTKLVINDECDAPSGSTPETIEAVFTSGTTKVKLWESDSASCIPPGGGAMAMYVPYTTFPVEGGAATATVWINCPTSLACEFPTNSQIKTQGAWVSVTLSASGGYDPTNVYVYSKGLSYRKLKTFVWSLGLP
ncbi:MAG: hypothetical protein ACKO70_12155 [Actinomycetota bacterium]